MPRQAQPGAVGPGTTRGAHHAAARGHPAPRPPPLQVDERADGAWHAEWATLRDLVRRTLVAASHAFDLAAELQVHADRMTATLGAARNTVLAEQKKMAELAGHTPTAAYVGEAGTFVDAVVDRARRTFAGSA